MIFEGLVILLACVHSATFFNSEFILAQKFEGLAAWITRHVSSENNLSIVLKHLEYH